MYGAEMLGCPITKDTTIPDDVLKALRDFHTGPKGKTLLGAAGLEPVFVGDCEFYWKIRKKQLQPGRFTDHLLKHQRRLARYLSKAMGYRNGHLWTGYPEGRSTCFADRVRKRALGGKSNACSSAIEVRRQSGGTPPSEMLLRSKCGAKRGVILRPAKESPDATPRVRDLTQLRSWGGP